MHIASGSQGSHLFVCVFGRRIVNGKEQILLVPFCSVRGGRQEDLTCVVEKGEHPFIDHPSYLAYNLAREEMVAGVVRHLNSAQFKPAEDVSAELMKRIEDGIRATDRVKQFVEANWL